MLLCLYNSSQLSPNPEALDCTYLLSPAGCPSGSAMRFRRPLADVEVRERDVAVLECEVPDESTPLAWYLEDQRLAPGAKYGMEQRGARRRLTIHDVGTDDDGVYLCETADGAKSIAELSVKGTAWPQLIL